MITLQIRRLDWPGAPLMEECWERFDEAFAAFEGLSARAANVDAILELVVPDEDRRAGRNSGYALARLSERFNGVCWQRQYANQKTYSGKTAREIYLEG